MKYKQLGKTDLKPSVLGFGCSRIASLTTRYKEQEVVDTLRQAFESGITFFDTADIYGQGDSECLLGKVFNKKRDEVIFCSKAGLTLSAPQQLIRHIKPVVRSGLRLFKPAAKATTKIRKKAEQQCFEPAYIRGQIEGSLKRLKTDYLDLFLLHNPPSEVIINPEITDLLETLKRKGLIRYYGISCQTHEDVHACLQQPGISCLQLNLDPGNIDNAKELLANLQSAGYGIIARECLANKTQLSNHPLVDSNLSAASQSLNAVLQHQEVDVALAGMACRKHLLDNLSAITN